MPAFAASFFLWIGGVVLFLSLIGVAGLKGSIAGLVILLSALFYVVKRTPGSREETADDA